MAQEIQRRKPTSTRVLANTKALLAKLPPTLEATPDDIAAAFRLGEGMREWAARCVIDQTAKRTNERTVLCREVAEVLNVKMHTVQNWVSASGLETLEARVLVPRQKELARPPRTVDERVATAEAGRDAARAGEAEERRLRVKAEATVRRGVRADEAGGDDLAQLTAIAGREVVEREMRRAIEAGEFHCRGCQCSGAAREGDADDEWVDP